MNIKLKLEIEFIVTNEEKPIGDAEKSYGGHVKIKTFIKEFFNHPNAVISYYSHLFVDKFLEKSNDNCQILAIYLKTMNNYGPLFVEIAKNCPPEVAEYISDIYHIDGNNRRDSIRKEIERRILEDELKSFAITNANLQIINPKNADNLTQKNKL